MIGTPTVRVGPTASRPSRALSSWLPAACAVHCVAAPLLVGTLPFLHGGEGLELVLLIVSTLIAVATLLESRRSHRKTAVWIPVLLGSALWGISLTEWFHLLPHASAAAAGGALVAAGVLWDGRLRHGAACSTRCDCPLPHRS